MCSCHEVFDMAGRSETTMNPFCVIHGAHHHRQLAVAMAVDRSAWEVGQKVWVHDEIRDIHGTYVICHVDWSVAAGPLCVEGFNDIGPTSLRSFWVPPWVCRHVPTTVEQIEEFLNG